MEAISGNRNAIFRPPPRAQTALFNTTLNEHGNVQVIVFTLTDADFHTYTHSSWIILLFSPANR